MFGELTNKQMLKLYKHYLELSNEMTRENPLEHIEELTELHQELRQLIIELNERGLTYDKQSKD